MNSQCSTSSEMVMQRKAHWHSESYYAFTETALACWPAGARFTRVVIHLYLMKPQEKGFIAEQRVNLLKLVKVVGCSVRWSSGETDGFLSLNASFW